MRTPRAGIRAAGALKARRAATIGAQKLMAA